MADLQNLADPKHNPMQLLFLVIALLLPPLFATF